MSRCALPPCGSPCAHCSGSGQHSGAQTVSMSDLKMNQTVVKKKIFSEENVSNASLNKTHYRALLCTC